MGSMHTGLEEGNMLGETVAANKRLCRRIYLVADRPWS